MFSAQQWGFIPKIFLKTRICLIPAPLIDADIGDQLEAVTLTLVRCMDPFWYYSGFIFSVRWQQGLGLTH